MLSNQKLTLSSLTEATRLNKRQSIEFAEAIAFLALAKNISLLDGTIGVWERCMIEDIENQCFDFEDFILAIKMIIRKPIYNRIDYADIYFKALNNALNRLQGDNLECGETNNRLKKINNFIREISPNKKEKTAMEMIAEIRKEEALKNG